ncbi:MAG: rhodanese-like domain-containing protein [Bacteroidales bacterium]
MKQPKILIIIAAAFALMIITGLLGSRDREMDYALSPQQTLETALSSESEVFPEELAGMLENDKIKCQPVDVRNPYDYLEGHIGPAINIPANTLLQKDNLRLLKKFDRDSVLMVLYGNDQSQADYPWLILKQVGINNIKVLTGGFAYYITRPQDVDDMPGIPGHLPEEPRYDFGKLMESIGGEKQPRAPDAYEMVIPVRRKKENKVDGGC